MPTEMSRSRPAWPGSLRDLAILAFALLLILAASAAMAERMFEAGATSLRHVPVETADTGWPLRAD